MLALAIALVLPATPSSAATAPTLATAGSFAVLASATITNTGPSVVNGDLGVSPGTAITGFEASDGGPGQVNGSVHAGDAIALQARADASSAYSDLAGQVCPDGNDLTGQDLVGLTLTAGVYCFSSSAQLSGALTLDAEGDPDAVFVFQIGSTLTTASDSSVLVTSSDAACNVFWQVGSAATLGTGTDFVGTILAGTEAVTAATGATVMGRLVSLNAAVTLDTNTVSASSCTDTSTPGDTTTTTSTTTTLEGPGAGGTSDGTTPGITDAAPTAGPTSGAPAGASSSDASPRGPEATGGGNPSGGSGDASDHGHVNRRLPATGAGGAMGVALVGALALAVGSGLRRASTRMGVAGRAAGARGFDVDNRRNVGR